MALVSDLSAQ